MTWDYDNYPSEPSHRDSMGSGCLAGIGSFFVGIFGCLAQIILSLVQLGFFILYTVLALAVIGGILWGIVAIFNAVFG